MALLMAAFVTSSAAVFMFLLVCPVFSYIPAISFTRDELLDIRKYTPTDISPVFIYSDVLLDIVVGGAAVLFRCNRARRWGKRVGALVKLRQRGFWTALPSIHLANLCPTKQTNTFCSPRLIWMFQTLLLCVSRKPGWMTQYWIARDICRISS